MTKKSEEEIKALISNEIKDAISYDQSEIASDRADAIKYFNGDETIVPVQPNRSKVVSRDVADAVSWAMPGLMRIFAGGDELVTYEPVGPEDEAGAQQATDAINAIFWKDCNGYELLHDWFHDALLTRVGIVKVWWDESKKEITSTHTGLTDEQLGLLFEDDENIEVIQHDERQEVIELDGQKSILRLHDIKIKRTEEGGKLMAEVIPPEDFLIDRNSRNLDADTRFACHRERKTRTELIEMGFDPETVAELSVFSVGAISEEEAERAEDRISAGGSVADRSMELIDYFECYVRLDLDGDNVAETVKVCAAGAGEVTEILDWEEIDDGHPFVDLTPYRVPHRWHGRSLADELMDIQRIKTTLMRQMLDNTYAANNPQREVEENSVSNPEELTSPTFGGTIWRKRGSAPIVPHKVPNVAGEAINAIRFIDEIAESRTGMSRNSQTLDPSTFRNQNVDAVETYRDAAHASLEFIARNFANTGLRDLFKRLLRLFVQHQDKERVIRIRNKWVPVDPRFWNAEMDCTVSVGLGSGSRDRDMNMLRAINQMQMTVVQMLGQDSPLTVKLIPKIRYTMAKIVEAAGMRSPENFFPEIDDKDIQALMQSGQQKPDPKLQLDMAKAQFEQQAAQFDMQIKQEEISLKREIEFEKIASQERMRLAEMEMEAGLAKLKFAQGGGLSPSDANIARS